MVEEQKIFHDGSCPFSVSENLNIEVTSYDLNFDGIIIRYGSTSGWKGENLTAPFHSFLMNVGDNDIRWKIPKDGKSENVIMKKNHIFFTPANTYINRFTKDYYQFILVLIEPEKMASSAKIVQKDIRFKEILNTHLPMLHIC